MKSKYVLEIDLGGTSGEAAKEIAKVFTKSCTRHKVKLKLIGKG